MGRILPQSQLCQYLDFRHLACRLWENNYAVLSHPVYGSLIRQPQETTVIYTAAHTLTRGGASNASFGVTMTWIWILSVSLPLSTYFSHSLPGQVAQQSGLEDITLKSDCLGPDLSSAAYCEKTLDKYLHISELQFSHLKYSDNNRAQS